MSDYEDPDGDNPMDEVYKLVELAREKLALHGLELVDAYPHRNIHGPAQDHLVLIVAVSPDAIEQAQTPLAEMDSAPDSTIEDDGNQSEFNDMFDMMTMSMEALPELAEEGAADAEAQQRADKKESEWAAFMEEVEGDGSPDVD